MNRKEFTSHFLLAIVCVLKSLLTLNVDRTLIWQHLTKTKWTDITRRYKTLLLLLLRLLDFSSKLTLSNEIKIYNEEFKPVWTYRFEVWCSTKHSKPYSLQTINCKILRKTFLFLYPTSPTAKEPFVQELFLTRYKTNHETVKNHPNPLVQ